MRSWYSAYIGGMYFVIGENESEYITHVGDVLKEDAELFVTEKRPAKVGERVLITEGIMTSGVYKTGDICTVRSVVNIYGTITVKEHSNCVISREYEVIVNNEVKNGEADGMESVNKTAIDSASTVFEKVGEDYIGSKSRFGDILIGAPYSEAFVKTYANERKDVLVIPQTIEYTAFLHNEEVKKVATHGQAPIVSAQARRDEIVEQAQVDVEERITNNTLNRVVYFVPNRTKRTVVALIKGEYSGKVYAKGIAKATPDDCFNVHIGKAIALRRALGLTVPDEYLNAPQPTEVRVGDVVRSTVDKAKEYVIAKGEKAWCDGMAGLSSMAAKYGRIIDDSREVVGE
ncbi:hypothetical protein D070_13530 [Bacillus velezensis]|uniref:hypothetical protein n=1 Tax=Bacillus velezensis TaxID=492670 RepID=UPI001126A450|nr:hypothetical protein [Bacillus velezensis]